MFVLNGYTLKKKTLRANRMCEILDIVTGSCGEEEADKLQTASQFT